MGLLDFIFRKKDKWTKQTHENAIKGGDNSHFISNIGKDNNIGCDPMLVKPKFPGGNPLISGGAVALPKEAVIDVRDIKFELEKM